jgi:hypothetical protein
MIEDFVKDLNEAGRRFQQVTWIFQGRCSSCGTERDEKSKNTDHMCDKCRKEAKKHNGGIK